MEESKAVYKKEGFWSTTNGMLLVATMGRKRTAAFIESQEAMLMYCVKELGGRIVLPKIEQEDLNLEMKISMLEDESCEILVRDKVPFN